MFASNRNAVAENCCCSVSLNCSVYRNRRISPKRRLAAVCRNSSRSVSTRSFCSFAGRLSQSFAASRRDTDSETVNPSAIPSQFKICQTAKNQIVHMTKRRPLHCQIIPPPTIGQNICIVCCFHCHHLRTLFVSAAAPAEHTIPGHQIPEYSHDSSRSYPHEKYHAALHPEP